MKPMSLPRFFQLSRLSRPVCDRVIYRAIKKHRIRSILEVGLGTGERALNMIKVAQRFAEGSPVRYTGIDLFEGRKASQVQLPLITAHKELNRLKAKTQLVPGEPNQTIPRIANSHLRTDLIVISAGYDPVSLERSWFYVPRMIHAHSIVFLQAPDGFDQPFEVLNRLQIEKLADKHGLRRPMAA